MTQDKLLDKLQKIKKMADGAAAIGSEAEAQAFAEMLQKMLIEHKLEMSDIEFEAYEKEEAVVKQMIDYSKYPDLELKKTRVLWTERLAGVIARAHMCRILVHTGSNRISLVGRKDDIAVAEYMIVTLFRATEKIAKTAHMKYIWEVYKRDGDTHAAQGFKKAFIQSFIMRLADRYREEQAKHKSSTALVRLSGQAADDFINKKTVDPNTGREKKDYKNAYSLTNRLSRNSEGHHRGREAANQVNLRANAMGAGSTSTKGQLK